MHKLIPIFLIIIALAAGTYIGYITGRRESMPKGPVIQINFLSTDFGRTTLIRTPEGKFILIDPGPRRTAAALITYLKETGVRSLDVLVTNPTVNRGGALEAIISRFKVNKFLHGEKTGASSAWRDAVDFARNRNIPETDIFGGDVINLSRSTKLEVLSPPHALLPDTWPDSDSNSLVVRITFKGKRFLFTSDVGEDAEAYLVKSRIDLENDVLVIPRGGKSGATTLEFLSCVRPEHCIISCTGHPSRTILQRIDQKNTGAQLHRTDKDGTISIVSDGRTLVVSKERGGRG